MKALATSAVTSCAETGPKLPIVCSALRTNLKIRSIHPLMPARTTLAISVSAQLAAMSSCSTRT